MHCQSWEHNVIKVIRKYRGLQPDQSKGLCIKTPKLKAAFISPKQINLVVYQENGSLYIL